MDVVVDTISYTSAIELHILALLMIRAVDYIASAPASCEQYNTVLRLVPIPGILEKNMDVSVYTE